MAKRRYAGTLNGQKGSSLALEAQFKDVIERVEYLIRLGELEVAEAIETGEPMVKLGVK